jgi:hypothetical protein
VFANEQQPAKTQNYDRWYVYKSLLRFPLFALKSQTNFRSPLAAYQKLLKILKGGFKFSKHFFTSLRISFSRDAITKRLLHPPRRALANFKTKSSLPKKTSLLLLLIAQELITLSKQTASCVLFAGVNVWPTAQK